MKLTLSKNSDDEAAILGEDGQLLATCRAANPGDPEFAAFTTLLAKFLGGEGRVLVMYRDGLPEEIRSDLPCEVLLVEEDRFDDPPIRLRRRHLPEGNIAKVDEAVTLIERQIAAFPSPKG
jgi:hypothetical protein